MAALLVALPAAGRAGDDEGSADDGGRTAEAAAPDANGAEAKARLSEDHYYLALGPVLAPDYDGSDEFDVYPLVIARWTRGGAFVEFRGSTLRANIIPASLFQVGPALSWRRKRDEVDDDRVDRLRDVSGALEAGGFVGIQLRDPDAPRRRLGLRLRALHDVSSAHDGYVAKLTLDGGTPLGGPWAIELAAFSHYASGNFMDSYFTIDPGNAALSGLRVFDASAGFKDVGIDAMLSYQLSDHWGLGLIGRYKRLIGDAADSPVVSDAGSANQFTVALTLTFRY